MKINIKLDNSAPNTKMIKVTFLLGETGLFGTSAFSSKTVFETNPFSEIGH